MRYAESRTRVRYKETDQMGIAHHSNYFVWFEIGRTDLCREVGIPYSEIERRGYLLVVSEISCRFRTPFLYDDEVVIRTSVGEIASRAMKFNYELYSAGDELSATGYSSHLWLDMKTRRPVRGDGGVVGAFTEWVARSPGLPVAR
jgi:acyl-CoA thioester hydrolase